MGMDRTELEQAVADARTRATQAAAARARAEVERERAEGALEAARTRLKDEFGVSTPAEATELERKLEQAVTTALAACREALERAGA